MMATTVTKRILLADDEPLYLNTTANLLRRAGYECSTAVDAYEAKAILSKESIDLLIVDLNMPGNMELELLHEGRRDFPEIPMIVATGAPSLPSAIDSVRLKMADYLLKPVKFEELISSIRKAIPIDGAVRGGQKESRHELLGESPPMLNVCELIGRAGATDVGVLVTGETGTGKELVAQAVHRASRRCEAPFVTIDCTAIPESLFESVLFGHAKGAFTGAIAEQPGLLKGANGGTVFLDEIGELPPASQSKLLRLLQHSTFTPVGQSKPVKLDIRFIAATNRDLAEEVRRGRFRRDLYYRLAVVPILLPPLRLRGEDLMILADYFLKEQQGEKPHKPLQFSAAAMECMKAYAWPGNVRELRNVVERVVALARGPFVERADLPDSFSSTHVEADRILSAANPTSRGQALSGADRLYLEELLRSCDGNISLAASKAGMSRQGLYKLLAKHDITPSEFRQA